MTVMKKSVQKIYFWLIAVVGIYSIWFSITGLGIPCYYRAVHGYECPGCGLTRMLSSTIKLQFGAAFRFNPVGFVAFWIWNSVAVLCCMEKTVLVKKPAFLYSLFTLTIAALLIQGLLRNLY